MHTWHQYKTPSVRDLAWLLCAPPLFNQPLEGFSPYPIAARDSLECWLRALDDHIQQEPQAFHAIDRTAYRRLGLYCESLLHFYFEHFPFGDDVPFDKVLRNVQVFSRENPRVTLGECDFLLPKKHRQIAHIELAVKFYLQTDSQQTTWDAWIGPNAIDRLDLKVNRMLNHQLPLPQHDDASDTFNQLTQDWHCMSEIVSRFFIKGMLFFPHENIGNRKGDDIQHATPKSHPNATHQYVLPKSANPDTLTGVWMRYSDFNTYLTDNPNKFYVCNKMEWLSGPETLAFVWESAASTCQKVLKFMRAADNTQKFFSGLMVLEQKDNDAVTHLMIVDDHWPETNSPLRRI